MEKELYTINKEAKRLRDQNNLYYEYKKPDSYVRPIYDTLFHYTVEYNKKLIDLDLIVEVDDEYYPWYAVHDVITILIEYAENEAQDAWCFSNDEIKDYIDKLNSIKYDINFCPTQLIKDNKQKISYIYYLKEKTLLKLLSQKKAKIVDVHTYDFTIKGDVVSTDLALIEYNGFYFHSKDAHTKLISSQKILKYTNSNNILEKKLNLHSCINKLEAFVEDK